MHEALELIVKVAHAIISQRLKYIIPKFFILFLSVLSLSATASETVDCEKPTTTLGINYCASIERNSAKDQLVRYLEAIYKHNASNPELVESIKKAQQDWQVYLISHCDSVYRQWKQGTIGRGISISCETHLIKRRTLEIWENFLNNVDRNSPILPKPEIWIIWRPVWKLSIRETCSRGLFERRYPQKVETIQIYCNALS